jgi:hypothetical protein
MTSSDYRAHSALLFKKLNNYILDIFKLNTHCIGIFMYIYSRNLLPECFDNLFISSNQVHNHNILELQPNTSIGLMHVELT